MTNPSSLEEAVVYILAEFPAEGLKAWANLPESEALSQSHFGLGLWVRNKWVHGGSPLVSTMRLIECNIHDDDISHIVINALWHVLHGAPCPELQVLIPSYSNCPVVTPLSWD